MSTFFDRSRLVARAFFVVPVISCLSACGGGAASSGGSTETVTLETSSVADATTGQAYLQTFVARVPHPPGVFILKEGTLPTGLVLDRTNGELRGYPRQAGIFRFAIAARDGVDTSIPLDRDPNFAEDRKSFSLHVSLGAPNILPQIVRAAQYRSAFGYQIDVAGGTPPYTFAKTGGVLPNGLSLNASGLLGSFPTQSQPAPYLFDVTVTDAHGQTDTETLSVQVFVLPLVIGTSSDLPGAAYGFPYNVPLAFASPGGGAPHTWSQAPLSSGEVLLDSIGLDVSSSGALESGLSGVTGLGTFKFTLQVTDEAAQLASRQFTLKVNPGPVLTSISPNRSTSTGPFTVTGLNFQPGAKLFFKPGVGQTVVSPTFINATTLRFDGPVSQPASGAGSVDLMVKNPDNGSDTKPNAFVFPASTIAFATKGFVGSDLSSTGLDAADVTGDGRADILHCGAAGLTPYSGASASTNAGLRLLINNGGSPPTFTSTTLDGGSYYDCKFIDVNSDGRPDVVALGAAQIRTWINNPLGTFTPGPPSNLGSGIVYPGVLATGRLNGDLIPDVAIGVPHNPNFGFSNTNGRVDVMLGTGTGLFVAQSSATNTMPWQYGVIAMACIDSDQDGRDELAVGVGMGSGNSGPPLNYAPTAANGDIGSWATRGTAQSPPLYASTTSVAVGAFDGSGKLCAITTNSSTYSTPARLLSLYSGPGLTTQTALAAPGTVMKCACPIDADFDPTMDFAVTTVTSTILVYRGGTYALVATLDAAAGLPTINSPRTGKMVSADLDGDGKPDLIATTSFWQVEEMAANYGSSYAHLSTGNGGSMGIVFYLNTSN